MQARRRHLGACTSAKEYTGLSEGSHSFEVKATDSSGNTDPTPASYTWTLDKTSPQTSITSGPSNPTNDNTPTFSFGGSDDLSAGADLLYSYRIDGGAWSLYSSETSVTLESLSDGEHTLYLKARDEAGNEDGSPAEQRFTVDSTAPSGTVSINNGASRTRTRSVTLTLSATDPSPGSGVTEMRISNTQSGLSSAPWETYRTSKAWTLTSGTGTKTVYVQYRDGAGNGSVIVTATSRYSP